LKKRRPQNLCRSLQTAFFWAWMIVACFIAPPADVHAVNQESTYFVLPSYERITLKNGLSVYLMEHHGVPLIHLSAIFQAGASKDGGKQGLAYLTAESLFSGTGKYRKRQLEDQLEFLGATYDAYAGLETAGIDISFMNSDPDRVFSVLKEVLRNAVFDPAEFEKRKKRLLLELVQAKEQPAGVIGAYFNKFIFGGHGYGNPVSGTPGTIKKITSQDAKAFYDAHYRPEESALVIVGDFQAGQMKKMVQEHFESWQSKGKHRTSAKMPLHAFSRSRVLLVNKSDATETQFLIGAIGIPRNHPDFVAVHVVNTILGGRFTSWLNDALRIHAGLTYGAGSSFNTFKDSGTFAISSFTGTENTEAAIDLALDVLLRLHIQAVDDESLSAAKRYLIGQFPPLYETPGSLASLLAAMFIYGIDESFVNDFKTNVDSITVEKAREVIGKHFPRVNLQFVLIGKATAIRDRAGKYGAFFEKDIRGDGY